MSQWGPRKPKVTTVMRVPAHHEVFVSKASGELALFWRRADDDALGVLGSLRSLGRPVTAEHAERAVALLREIGEPGALRLAATLDRACTEREMVVTWHHDPLPPGMVRKDKPKRCVYYTEPLTKRRCQAVGLYSVAGACGTFCELHGRRTAVRLERRPNLRAKKEYARKKNKGTPTTTS